MKHRINSVVRRCGLAALAASSFLAACTTSRTFVLEPAMGARVHIATSIERLPSTVEIDPALATTFESQLTRKLAPETSVVAGDSGDLSIRYRFVLYDTGSTAARVGAGVASLAGSPFYGLGDGALGVDVTFTSADGRVRGHIVVDGPISGAFGSTESGLASAAASIAKYTKANFAPDTSMASDGALADTLAGHNTETAGGTARGPISSSEDSASRAGDDRKTGIRVSPL